MVDGLRRVQWLGFCGFLALGACTGKGASDTDIGSDTDTDGDTDTDTGDAPVGVVSVSPSALEFDALEWGCDAVSTVSISNTGDGDLTLSSLDIAPAARHASCMCTRAAVRPLCVPLGCCALRKDCWARQGSRARARRSLGC